jgi:histidine triad (HIT) family protein
MAYDYDDQNVFARILRGEIPNSTVLETEHTLAFHDIRGQAPVHVLVIPKGRYVTYDHFAAEASDAEIVDFTRAVAKLCAELEVAPENGSGYRLIANAGGHGHQEVAHMHVHILGGRPLGAMLAGGTVP